MAGVDGISGDLRRVRGPWLGAYKLVVWWAAEAFEARYGVGGTSSPALGQGGKEKWVDGCFVLNCRPRKPGAGTYWPAPKGSSWPFMLSFRDARCDAKDGVATDRRSLLPSELGDGGHGAVRDGRRATLHCRTGPGQYNVLRTRRRG